MSRSLQGPERCNKSIKYLIFQSDETFGGWVLSGGSTACGLVSGDTEQPQVIRWQVLHTEFNYTLPHTDLSLQPTHAGLQGQFFLFSVCVLVRVLTMKFIYRVLKMLIFHIHLPYWYFVSILLVPRFITSLLNINQGHKICTNINPAIIL